MTPDEALARLKEGNERFASGRRLERDHVARVRATAADQHPFAAVLACSDSRVSPELVFDQGIGDIFAVRIAGNFANADIIGSLEFATKLAGAKLIVVVGHTACGAVQGACDGVRLGNLTHTLGNLAAAVSATVGVPGERNADNAAFVRAVSEQNVRRTVQALTDRSGVLRGLVREGKLRVVGAMYDVATGRVSYSA